LRDRADRLPVRLIHIALMITPRESCRAGYASRC
jgi:hypothetical protein